MALHLEFPHFEFRTLAIYLFAVANVQHEDHNALVLNGADEPVIADAIFPKFSKLVAVEHPANAARIVQLGNTLQKFQNTVCNLSI